MKEHAEIVKQFFKNRYFGIDNCLSTCYLYSHKMTAKEIIKSSDQSLATVFELRFNAQIAKRIHLTIHSSN